MTQGPLDRRRCRPIQGCALLADYMVERGTSVEPLCGRLGRPHGPTFALRYFTRTALTLDGTPPTISSTASRASNVRGGRCEAVDRDVAPRLVVAGWSAAVVRAYRKLRELRELGGAAAPGPGLQRRRETESCSRLVPDPEPSGKLTTCSAHGQGGGWNDFHGAALT